jgi:chromosome segregation ATPase
MTVGLTTELRAFLEEIRGDVRKRIDELLTEIRGIAGAQRTTTNQVADLTIRVAKLEMISEKLTGDVLVLRRTDSESRAEFSDRDMALARILTEQNEAADARFARIEQAMREEQRREAKDGRTDSRIRMLGMAIAVVVTVMWGAGRMDAGQYVGALSVAMGGTAGAMRYLDRKRQKQEGA